MKIIFAGTPEFAIAPLNALSRHCEIAAVLTQPDRPQGRKGILTPPPVKEEALRRKLPIFQPERVRDCVASLKAFGAELMVTCAYGQILSQEVLDAFSLGVWNIHASLLPAYRGAAPIARCIMDGEKETGVTVMRTELGLDTGGILLKRAIPIGKSDTAGTLSQRLSLLGAELIVEAIEKIGRGEAQTEAQGAGFVCKKVERTPVDFSRSAEEVSALIRSLSPSPLAYGTVGELTLNFHFAEEIAYSGREACGEIISAEPKSGLLVRCGENAVRLSLLQPAGGRVMTDRDFLNGRKVKKGQCFDKPVL